MTVEAGTDAALAPTTEGVRLGRYELLGEIASGGMATVYLGRAVGARGFSRLVAIKRMHPHLERDEEFVTSFLEEARLAARIRHTNVVATLDVEDGEAPYLVMEYVEGDRLSGLIKEHVNRAREGLPLPIALRCAIDALEGLHAAHDLRDDDGAPLDLIHRDISPQNVLVGVDGVARVTDFGIAKAAGRASHTREGELKGKIAYMAPEQLTNPNGIDRRVDVFAMGVVCWEMLTGRRLFRAATDMETIGVILHHEITQVRAVAPAIPERVEAVVMRALERDPAMRWQSAQDFARALDSLGLAAPTRVVADFVKATVGDKLARERARLRSGWSTNTPTPMGAAPKATGEFVVSEVRRTGTTPNPSSSVVLTAPGASNRSKLIAITVVSSLAVIALGVTAVVAMTRKSDGPPRVVERVVTVPAAGNGPQVIATEPVRNGQAAAEQDAGVAATEATAPVRRTNTGAPSRRTQRRNNGHEDVDGLILGQPTFDRPR
ncbi:MAG: serine/threonine protein kinase [Myxococcales bacterium]|nr:serine/threonine protein kinase [Myxococcales bacterium]